MRNRLLIMVLLAVIVILAGAVTFLLLQPAKQAPTAGAVATPSGVASGVGSSGVGSGVTGSAAANSDSTAVIGGGARVVAVTVIEASIGRPVRLTGNVTPIRDVTLVSKVPGTVVWAAGGMGTRVEVGEPVLRLDATELQLNFDQASAGHAAASANLARLEAGAAPEEIAQVEAAVEQARLALERVATVLDRQEQLFAQGIISEETLLGVRTEHDVARLQFGSAQQQLALVKRGATQEERRAVRAQVQQAEVAVKLAEQQLADTVIRAPFTGLLASQPVQIGTLIGAGTPIGGIVDIARVVIEANVGEREINQIRIGDTVIVTVDTLAGTVLAGGADQVDQVAGSSAPAAAVDLASGVDQATRALRSGQFLAVIDAVAPVADRQTGTFPVRFVVDNADHVLKPGMVARVEVQAGLTAPGPVVPTDAVVTRSGNTFVYVPDVDGSGRPAADASRRRLARERAVRVEAQFGGLALIRSGLSVGDTVLVPEPGASIRDGSPIQIVREAL